MRVCSTSNYISVSQFYDIITICVDMELEIRIHPDNYWFSFNRQTFLSLFTRWVVFIFFILGSSTNYSDVNLFHDNILLNYALVDMQAGRDWCRVYWSIILKSDWTLQCSYGHVCEKTCPIHLHQEYKKLVHLFLLFCSHSFLPQNNSSYIKVKWGNVVMW